MSKLQDMRRKRGLSQTQLSGLTGINVGTLRHYEQGSKKLEHAKLDTILILCIALGCQISDLVENPETLDKLNIYMETETR